MKIGEKIKEIRLKNNITQKELGDAIGIDGATIRKYENGKLKPKAETIDKIARALGVDAGFLSSAELTSSKAMISLFSIYDNFRGKLKSDGEKVYIEFEALEPLMQMWHDVRLEYLNSISKANEIDNEEERNALLNEAKYKYDKWIYTFPRQKNVVEILKLMDSWDEYDENLDGIVLDELFDKIHE